MARPVKWRKVDFVPTVKYFAPVQTNSKAIEETVLKVEELEALRLKDYEGLEQDECANRMEVSRATFQKILSIARSKVTDSLIRGKAIKIDGGSFTQHICRVQCLNCGKTWDESCEQMYTSKSDGILCPDCGSNQITCTKNCKGKMGNGNCHRYGKN